MIRVVTLYAVKLRLTTETHGRGRSSDECSEQLDWNKRRDDKRPDGVRRESIEKRIPMWKILVGD